MYTHTVGLNQLNRPIKEEGPFNLPQALNKQNTDIRRAVFGLPAFQPLYLKHGGMPKDYMKKGGKPKGYGAKGPVMMTPKGKDNVPVMMQEDEYVLPAKAVKKMGGAKKLDKKVEKMTGHRPGKMMKGKTNYAQYGLSPEEEKLKPKNSDELIIQGARQGINALAQGGAGINTTLQNIPQNLKNIGSSIGNTLNTSVQNIKSNAETNPSSLRQSYLESVKGGAGPGYAVGKAILEPYGNVYKAIGDTGQAIGQGVKQFFKPPSPQTTKPSYGATETPEKRNVASFTPAYTGTGENERVFPGARGGVETVPIPKTQTDRRIYGPGGVDLGENPTQAEIDKYIGGGAAKDSELERYKKYLNAQADAQQRADLAASFRQATELQNSGQVLPGAVPLNYGAAFEPSRQNVELNIAQGRQATDIANQTAANALEQRKLAQRQQEFQQSPNAQLTVAAKDLYDIERNPEVAKILADENDTSEYANAVRNRVITLRDLVERLKKGSTSSFGAY